MVSVFLNLFQIDTITFRALKESDKWDQQTCIATTAAKIS